MELLNCIQWVWIITRWWRWSSGSDSECRAKEKSWELWEDRWGRGEELYDLSHRSSIRRHPTGDGSKWGLNGRHFAWAEGSIFRWKGSCHKMPKTMWKGTYLLGKLQPSKWKRSLQASRRTRAHTHTPKSTYRHGKKPHVFILGSSPAILDAKRP